MAAVPRLLSAVMGRWHRPPFYDVSWGALSSRQTVASRLHQVLNLREPAAHYQLVREFEQEFAERFSGGMARGVNSGTSALYLALKAVGVGPGKDVITVANTFVSTITAILETGARCLFADIDADSGMMLPASVEALITPTIGAIVPVHMYGGMAPMDRLLPIARKAGVPVVEDACQALGARQGTSFAGCSGTVGCFSFHATKLVGAPGDGGMVFTRSKPIYEAVCQLAEPDWKGAFAQGQHRIPSRLSALTVPILRARLAELEEQIEHRTQQYEHYMRDVSNLPGFRLLNASAGTRSTWRNVILISRGVDVVAELLRRKGLPSRKIYPQSLALVEEIERSGQSIPNTRKLLTHHLALPLGPHISNGQIANVTKAIHEAARAVPTSDRLTEARDP